MYRLRDAITDHHPSYEADYPAIVILSHRLIGWAYV